MALVVVVPQSLATMPLILSGSSGFIKHAHPHGLEIFGFRTIGGDRLVGRGAGSGEDLKVTGRSARRLALGARRLAGLPRGGVQYPQEFRLFEQTRTRAA